MNPHIERVIRFLRRQPRWRLAAAAALLLLLGLFWHRSGPAPQDAVTFTARRGNLPIAILNGGSIEALEAQIIRSEVKGMQGTKILKIVEEGYQVTEQDVADKKILVELDSSELEERIIAQEITFLSTLASRTEAQQAYEIQLNQNRTDINSAEQKARFALMDFQKFLGEALARKLVDEHGLQEESLAASLPSPALTNGILERLPIRDSTTPPTASHPSPPQGAGDGGSGTGTMPGTTSDGERPGGGSNGKKRTDFGQYAKVELLADGSAKQQLRKLEDALLLSRKDLGMAQTKMEATRRLFAKGFVSKTEHDNDQVALDKTTLQVKTAETELALFIKYEFPKQAEEFLSKYEEALNALIRARKEAISKLAQAEAKLRAAEARFKIESQQRQELRDQREKCVIRAERPGLVVYGAGREERFFGGDEQIREGATVRERQRIITIPDMTEMAVQVKIHESHIKRIKKGQQARITVEAFPEEELAGEISKVGVLPDSQNRWLNPDLKVYLTTISIKDVRTWLKPGMTAKVQILITQLVDVVYVPIQAVSSSQGKNLCHVVRGSRSQERTVEVGEFNDDFIEIKQGLREGEMVLLRAPETGWEEPVLPEAEPAKGPPAAQSPPPARAPAKAPAAAPAAPARTRPPPDRQSG